MKANCWFIPIWFTGSELKHPKLNDFVRQELLGRSISVEAVNLRESRRNTTRCLNACNCIEPLFFLLRVRFYEAEKRFLCENRHKKVALMTGRTNTTNSHQRLISWQQAFWRQSPACPHGCLSCYGLDHGLIKYFKFNILPMQLVFNLRKGKASTINIHLTHSLSWTSRFWNFKIFFSSFHHQYEKQR